MEESSRTMDWMVRQIKNQDTQIEYNHHNLYEIMGNISYMKDDLKDDLRKPVNMNQSSHMHDYPSRVQAMEEASMVQPVIDPKGKQQV